MMKKTWFVLLPIIMASIFLLTNMCSLQARVDAVEQYSQWVRVTHYEWTGSPMYNGEWPHAGAAACSWNFPLGTVIVFPDGREVVCKDRGALGGYGWVDVYGSRYDIASYNTWEVVEVWE